MFKFSPTGIANWLLQPTMTHAAEGGQAWVGSLAHLSDAGSVLGHPVALLIQHRLIPRYFTLTWL